MTLNPDMLTAEELEALRNDLKRQANWAAVHLAAATPAVAANVTIGYGR
jgi:hypothetical protein